jgi:HEAT repeat protein
VKLLEELLKSQDYHVRAAATRVFFYWKDHIPDTEQKLMTMSRDQAPRVRLEAIVALSHFKTEEVVEALLAVSECQRIIILTMPWRKHLNI